MKKEAPLILLAAVLILAAAVPAAPAVIFDSGVRAGYSYQTSTGEQFSVSYIDSEGKLVVDFPGDSLIIENKSCSVGAKLNACYGGAVFIGYNASGPYREVYEYGLAITRVAPDITLAKDVDEDEIDVGKSTTISVNITNAGSGSGTVYFLEAVPLGFSIAEVPGQPCQLALNNTLTIVKEMKPGERLQCTYRVTALEPGTFILGSAAEFDVVAREKAALSAQVKVKDLPLLVNATYPSSVPLGRAFNMTLLLKSSAMVSSLVAGAFIPAGLEVDGADKVASLARKKEGVIVGYGSTLTSLNGTVSFNISLEAITVGIVGVAANATWSYGGIKQAVHAVFPVNGTLESPYARLLSFDNKTGEAVVQLVNPSHIAIRNATAFFEGFSGGSEPLFVESVEGGSHATFTLLPTGVGGSLYAINYSTPYGQRMRAAGLLSIAQPKQVSAPSPKIVQEEKLPEAEAPVSAESAEKQEENPKPGRGMAELRRAAIFAGAIIALVAFFLVLRVRKLDRQGAE